jgi:transposase-like protein
MNMIERGGRFVQRLRALAQRSPYDWRECPRCGSRCTRKHGSYTRRPWRLSGRQVVRVQRHWCALCGRTYREEDPGLRWKAWYGREVQRQAVDGWVHLRGSLRRMAEWLRSQLGQQERWEQWYVWGVDIREEGQAGRCRLSASTIQRWVARAGAQAEEQRVGQLAGVACSGQMGSDGLWARLHDRSQRVLLALVDSATGVVWAVKVAAEEESRQGWAALLTAAEQGGLLLSQLRGLTSDGAQGLLSYLRQALSWVHHQRCIWHFWRSLAADLARAVARAVTDLAQQAAHTVGPQVRTELITLLRAVLDAPSHEQAELALQQLRAHPWGTGIAQKVNEQFDRLLYYRLEHHRGLLRVGPEWLWRDFRLRLSRGRNHGSEQRLERAGLLWLVYHNLTPAQMRVERKRHWYHGIKVSDARRKAGSATGTPSPLRRSVFAHLGSNAVLSMACSSFRRPQFRPRAMSPCRRVASLGKRRECRAS